MLVLNLHGSGVCKFELDGSWPIDQPSIIGLIWVLVDFAGVKFEIFGNLAPNNHLAEASLVLSYDHALEWVSDNLKPGKGPWHHGW